MCLSNQKPTTLRELLRSTRRTTDLFCVRVHVCVFYNAQNVCATSMPSMLCGVIDMLAYPAMRAPLVRLYFRIGACFVFRRGVGRNEKE